MFRFMAYVLVLAIASTAVLPHRAAAVDENWEPSMKSVQDAEEICQPYKKHSEAEYVECKQKLERQRLEAQKSSSLLPFMLIMAVPVAVVGFLGYVAVKHAGGTVLIPTKQLKQLSGQPVPEASLEKTDGERGTAKDLPSTEKASPAVVTEPAAVQKAA